MAMLVIWPSERVALMAVLSVAPLGSPAASKATSTPRPCEFDEIVNLKVSDHSQDNTYISQLHAHVGHVFLRWVNNIVGSAMLRDLLSFFGRFGTNYTPIQEASADAMILLMQSSAHLTPCALSERITNAPIGPDPLLSDASVTLSRPGIKLTSDSHDKAYIARLDFGYPGSMPSNS
jgi:hypothetical protein